jgi:hypothetical protein
LVRVTDTGVRNDTFVEDVSAVVCAVKSRRTDADADADARDTTEELTSS